MLGSSYLLFSASLRLLLRCCFPPTFQTAPPLSPSWAHPIFASTMWMLLTKFPILFAPLGRDPSPNTPTHPALSWGAKGQYSMSLSISSGNHWPETRIVKNHRDCCLRVEAKFPIPRPNFTAWSLSSPLLLESCIPRSQWILTSIHTYSHAPDSPFYSGLSPAPNSISSPVFHIHAAPGGSFLTYAVTLCSPLNHPPTPIFHP